MDSADTVRRDDEFVAFVDAAMPRLRRTAFLMVGDWHYAEDITQTVLVNVYRRWPQVDAAAGPWARTFMRPWSTQLSASSDVRTAANGPWTRCRNRDATT